MAVVGRPNVGKSMLVNRIIGRREAVVQDLPGVTRDRVSYDAEWNGREFVVVDTGGWAPDAKGMAAQIAEQAELAIAAADVVLFVVDAGVGTQDVDEAVVEVLRRSRKPVILAANKVDDLRQEADAAAMWNLGLGEDVYKRQVAERVQRERTPQRDDEMTDEVVTTARAVDYDAILDEIDSVLEADAVEYVRSFVQKGGQ